MLRSLRHLACLSLLCGALACGSAEDTFTDGRTAVGCDATIPVCSTVAGCVLDNATYTSGSFAEGGTRRVVVRTTTAALIEVDLFLRTESTPGTDTEVAWYETSCTARTSQDNAGTDIFEEAGPSRVWTRTGRVDKPGDHIVEVFSDAQADYLLRVVVTPTQ